MERARGSLEKAREAIGSAEDFIREHPLTPYWSMWVNAALAHGCLDLGKVEQARLHLQESGVLSDEFVLELEMNAQSGKSLEAPIPYRIEPAAMVLARLFLALGNPDAVLTVCERLLPEAKAGGRGKVLIELFILQALAFHARKDTSSALAALEQALHLARPEQSMRVFLDEGERMAKLLFFAKAHRSGGDFVDELLSAMDQQDGAGSSPAHPSGNGPATGAQRGGKFLVEPLSDRELEVLRCIAEGCSNQEIADRFVLSPKTVKRHISNIYAKLEAKNRTQAVALARALKLIE